jgi:flavin-dependent dehydrogenase
MTASAERDTDVLITGAGPTGLVLALWLTKLGVRVRIVDKTAEAGTTSRAVAVQAHVYGAAEPEIQAVCDERRLPLHVFPWRGEMGRTGLRRDTVYLVRPDGYVALVNSDGGAAAVASYLDALKITPAR